jgi:hypothetical protein
MCTIRLGSNPINRATFLSHGFSAHFNAMGVVNQTIEDAISDGGITDLFMPARDWQLRSEGGRPGLVAILADLPDFTAFVFIQRCHGPVIDDQNVDAAQSCQEVAQAPIGSGQAQIT